MQMGGVAHTLSTREGVQGAIGDVASAEWSSQTKPVLWSSPKSRSHVTLLL